LGKARQAEFREFRRCSAETQEAKEQRLIAAIAALPEWTYLDVSSDVGFF
jgi:hypothetical protein